MRRSALAVLLFVTGFAVWATEQPVHHEDRDDNVDEVGVGIGLGIGIGRAIADALDDEEEERPAEPPPKTPSKPKPKKRKPPARVVTLDSHGMLASSQVQRPEDCCKFTSMTIRNTWERDVEVILRNEDGVETGRQTIRRGHTHTFRGELGECVRIIVKSAYVPHSLVESVGPLCCKDLGARRLFFYGIQLRSFTWDQCDEGQAAQPEPVIAQATPEPEPTPVNEEEGLTFDEDKFCDGYSLRLQVRYGLDLGFGGTVTRPLDSGTTGEEGGIVVDDDDGDDPRDVKPPEQRYGILLEEVNEFWIPEWGNSTPVTAQIYEWRGRWRDWIPSEVEKIITFRFPERSNERGVCLNWTDIANEEDEDAPDLYFFSGENRRYKLEDDPMGKGVYYGTATTKRKKNRATVVVHSGDYGSFGKIEATAPGCVPLKKLSTGEVVECTREEARKKVPKDDNDNQIADWYWDDRTYSPQATEDEDDDPAGDPGKKGDGFSAYEEYRGFRVKRRHRRNDLKRKDLFVHDRDNIGGVWKFQASSGIRCHEIDLLEFKNNRVVNYNWGHANAVQQHCIILVNEPLEEGVSGRAVHSGSLMGPPKDVEKAVVDVSKFAGAWAASGTVAHELGHSCGVWHHADPGEDGEVTTIHPSGVLNTLAFWRTKSSQSEVCGKTLPAEFWLGNKQNRMSGNHQCVMKYYHRSDAVYRTGNSYECVDLTAHPEERDLFCTSGSGTGSNAGGRCAGNASRGNCKNQLFVNDRYD